MEYIFFKRKQTEFPIVSFPTQFSAGDLFIHPCFAGKQIASIK